MNQLGKGILFRFTQWVSVYGGHRYVVGEQDKLYDLDFWMDDKTGELGVYDQHYLLRNVLIPAAQISQYTCIAK